MKSTHGNRRKPITCGTVSAITQDSNENPIAFLDKLKEALKKFTNLDLDSYEGQAILKDKFLSQCEGRTDRWCRSHTNVHQTSG